jgi:hypothetical protein
MPHFVVAEWPLERRDFVGHEGFEFAGARDRALDAVAHGGDFAADRLTDGHHRVGGRALGLEKRIATCAIDCAIMRNSWPRQARLARK